ncbi:MAG: type II secretion system major pseudopilin GspG [Candidatus Sumerlaeia bacterium]|nr:type II secretion system major pseudopilin GspG [Candidatus Sumerlaeia bacterium]
MSSFSRQQRRKAFTFIEIMFVVVIIGVLLAVAVPRLTGQAKEAKIRATELSIKSVTTALQKYELEVGDFPSTSEGLEALLKEPSNASGWKGPYVDDFPTDAWGNKLNYRQPSEHGRDFDLWSNGPDKQEGNDDDVKNWKTK